MKIVISMVRVSEDGNQIWKAVNSVAEVTDIESIFSIRIYGEKDELEVLNARFPKSQKWTVRRYTGWENGTVVNGFNLGAEFNTLHTNNKTGDKNESAAARRKAAWKSLNDLNMF